MEGKLTKKKRVSRILLRFVALYICYVVVGIWARSRIPLEGLTIDEADKLFDTFRYINGEPLTIYNRNANLSLSAVLQAPIIRMAAVPYHAHRVVFSVVAGFGLSLIILTAYLLFGVYGLLISGITIFVSRLGFASHLFPHATTLTFLPIGVFWLIFAFFYRSRVLKKLHLYGCSAVLGMMIFMAVFTYPGARSLIPASVLLFLYVAISGRAGLREAVASLLICFMVAYSSGFCYASLCHDAGTGFWPRIRAVNVVYLANTGWGKYAPPSQYPAHVHDLFLSYFEPKRTSYAAVSNRMSVMRAPALPLHLIPLTCLVMIAIIIGLARYIFRFHRSVTLRQDITRDMMVILVLVVGIAPAVASDMPDLRRSLLGISAIILLCSRPIVSDRFYPRAKKACSVSAIVLVLVSAGYTAYLLKNEYFTHVPYHRAGTTRKIYETVKLFEAEKDIQVIFIPDDNPYRFTSFYADPAFAAAMKGRIVPWDRVSAYVNRSREKTVVGIICERINQEEFYRRYVPPGTGAYACNIGRYIESDIPISVWNNFAVACWGKQWERVKSLLPEPRHEKPLPYVPNI